MADLEKTIEGLEDFIECYKAAFDDGGEAPLEDAFALLKVQVPCSPIKSPNYNYSHYGYNCPRCGHTLHVGEDRPNYCQECGQALKWE